MLWLASPLKYLLEFKLEIFWFGVKRKYKRINPATMNICTVKSDLYRFSSPRKRSATILALGKTDFMFQIIVWKGITHFTVYGIEMSKFMPSNVYFVNEFTVEIGFSLELVVCILVYICVSQPNEIWNGLFVHSITRVYTIKMNSH